MPLDVRTIGDILKRRRAWLIWPILSTTGLALLYALLAPRYWSATQALYVREEGTHASHRLGRFESVDAMQTAQETILEIARHHSVLASALRDVGPERRLSASAMQKWPSTKSVDALRSKVQVSAPRGAQFGRTELIYLTTRAQSTDRAIALNRAVASRLIERMQQLRRDKYQGILQELEKSCDLARRDLTQATTRVRDLETAVGADLPELRALISSGSGDGQLHRSATEISSEIRQSDARLAAKRQELVQLRAAMQDPRKLIALSSDALDHQPLLKRLKVGLVEAELEVSRTLGQLNPDHPRSKAAIQAEAMVREQLHQEISLAVESLTNEIKVLEEQVGSIQSHGLDADQRMRQLAELRTQYATALADVDQRTALLETAETDLAQAQANLQSAKASTLIHLVEIPVPSSEALGPGRSTIVGLGLLSGLGMGLGLILLLEPAPSPGRRRWTDHLPLRRRATDPIRSEGTTPRDVPDRRTSAPGGRRQCDLHQADGLIPGYNVQIKSTE